MKAYFIMMSACVVMSACAMERAALVLKENSSALKESLKKKLQNKSKSSPALVERKLMSTLETDFDSVSSLVSKLREKNIELPPMISEGRIYYTNEYVASRLSLSHEMLIKKEPPIIKKLLAIGCLGDVAALKNIQALDLSGHKITTFSLQDLCTILPHLRLLDLSHNKINVLKREQLEDMPSDFILKLDHNPIIDVEQRALAPASYMTVRNSAILLRGTQLTEQQLAALCKNEPTFCKGALIDHMKKYTSFWLVLMGYILNKYSTNTWTASFCSLLAAFFACDKRCRKKHVHLTIESDYGAFEVPRCSMLPKYS